MATQAFQTEIQEIFIFISVIMWLILPMVIWICIKVVNIQRKRVSRAKENEETQKSLTKSQRTKHGQMWEQLIPFSKDFPYDPQEFTFLGSPIDGIQFENNKIVLVEFKTGKANMTKRQRHIKKLVDKGKVEFNLIRVS